MTLREEIHKYLDKHKVGDVINLSVSYLSKPEMLNTKSVRIYEALKIIEKHGYIEVEKDIDTGRPIYKFTKILKKRKVGDVK